MGSANAAVLPVPVCALPMTSRPAIIRGMALNWIGVGSVKPIAFTPCKTAEDNPKLVNMLQSHPVHLFMQAPIKPD